MSVGRAAQRHHRAERTRSPQSRFVPQSETHEHSRQSMRASCKAAPPGWSAAQSQSSHSCSHPRNATQSGLPWQVATWVSQTLAREHCWHALHHTEVASPSRPASHSLPGSTCPDELLAAVKPLDDAAVGDGVEPDEGADDVELVCEAPVDEPFCAALPVGAPPEPSSCSPSSSGMTTSLHAVIARAVVSQWREPINGAYSAAIAAASTEASGLSCLGDTLALLRARPCLGL